MATFVRRKYRKGYSYRATVRRQGFKPMVKSFDNITDAKRWARKLEREIDLGNLTDYSEASKLTLGDIIKRYEIEDKHKDRKDESIKSRINNLLSDSISDINLLNNVSFYYIA